MYFGGIEGTPPKGRKHSTGSVFGQIGLLTKVCFFTKAQVVFMGDNHTSPEGIMGLIQPKGPIMQPKGRRTLVRGPRAA